MANEAVLVEVFQVVGYGVGLPGGMWVLATGLDAAHAARLAAHRQADSDEDQDGTRWLVQGYAVELTDEGVDDWEGPEAEGYSERDDEAFDEMVRDDMAGRF